MVTAMKCMRCKKRPRKKHFNSKYCKQCAQELIKKPRSNLSKEKRVAAVSLAGIVPVKIIAQELGTSVASLKRFGRDHCVSFNTVKYKEDVVKKVIAYYEKNGKKKTSEKFPEVNVRSIVERHDHVSRQIRWKEHELIELARMAGIISKKNQAKYFNRPNANVGSIVSVWVKKFKMGGDCVNGLSYNTAKYFIKDECPAYKTDFWASRHSVTKHPMARRIVLWVDMYKYANEDVPSHIKKSLKTMAKYQRWLWGTKNVNKKVEEMICQRN